MKKMMMMMMALAVMCAVLTGCAVVSGKAGNASYVGWAFGEKASSTLAGLNITEDQESEWKVSRGVGVDSAGSSSETKLTELLGKMLLAGLSAYAHVPEQVSSNTGANDPAAARVDANTPATED